MERLFRIRFSFIGSNTGIGKTSAIDLAKRGARVILACRSKQRGEAALEEVKRVRITKTDDELEQRGFK